MSNIEGKVIAITGASSGIGEAAAKVLAAAGAHIVIGARRIERLERLAGDIGARGGMVRLRKLDVTDRSEVEAFAAFARSEFGRLDVIVNNAGVMPLSPLEALKVDVNIKGVLYGIAAALPIMKAQGSGQIINLSSIGGHSVSPTAAVYCATKFAVRAISDGLRQETDRIRVTVISPGTTTSELADTITDPTARDAMKAFRAITISPDSIANSILYAVSQPDDVDVSEIIIRPTASPH
ncbi:SDR family oxidoreductase [Rhizobium lentis]|uniref:Serine 3-dehydrogenase n=1 Tax=Rhizobium lentis TaxID=1138194 RepID=A0A7W8ULT2_9HYPH|nr:SDR family oxidoreductase [Rhizobium lentis]MBB4573095.1 NADP-dependent 3-hydroxy acid dehydrogenase YdfG [Rhizobium lentis]MBB5549024.1 NADP-dependent 3-hydroxy acid dehydrogenase YdfG [Rhizobium lentis]MBB5559557.1 NADP-dependent 3-hydroxy acid dehydrogenase YdfG [Rhizobium lentis]MBB5566559.1 NADP-dependent 3-hydroxy acid dehydrogenase YdfG [Rhizobium lentis]